MVLTKNQKVKLRNYLRRATEVEDTFEDTQIVKEYMSEPKDTLGEIGKQGREQPKLKQIVGELESVKNRLARIESRMVLIEKLRKKEIEIAGELQAASSESGMASIEKVTKKQIAGELESVKDRLANLECLVPMTYDEERVYVRECLQRGHLPEAGVLMTFEEEQAYISECLQRGEDRQDIYSRLGY